MGAKRLLITGLLLLIGLMLFEGLYKPEAPLMWLASTSVEYAYLRATLLIVLVTLLVSSPPRSAFFRLLLASFALTIGIGTAVLSYSHAIPLLDAVVFIEVAIVFMIEALEADIPTEKKVSLRDAGQKEIHI